MFTWVIGLFFVYKLLCTKYERQLIDKKEKEINDLMKHSDEISNTTDDLRLEDYMMYWRSQAAGITKL